MTSTYHDVPSCDAAIAAAHHAIGELQNALRVADGDPLGSDAPNARDGMTPAQRATIEQQLRGNRALLHAATVRKAELLQVPQRGTNPLARA